MRSKDPNRNIKAKKPPPSNLTNQISGYSRLLK